MCVLLLGNVMKCRVMFGNVW